MTSFPVEVCLYIETSPEARSIILLRPYKSLESFHDKQRNYTNFKKGPRFFETPCSRGSSKKHSCEIILNSANWPRRRCCLKGFSIFSFDSHFVQRSGTILAILVEGHPRNISVKLF